MPIDIVILTYYRLQFTKKCLEFLYKRTKHPYRLIVVDNNSQDGTKDFLLEEHKAGRIHILILLDKNVGPHLAKNYALRFVKSDKYYIDSDNDILVPDLEPCWLTQLMGLMDKHQDYGALGLRIQVMPGSGNIFDEKDDIKIFSHVGGSMRMLRTQLVKEVGGWENIEVNGKGNEERDISKKIRDKGYNVGFTQFIKAYHMFTKNWGYPEDVENGHRAIWPPPEHYERLVNPKTFDLDAKGVDIYEYKLG